jgi:hypothetical protein
VSIIQAMSFEVEALDSEIILEAILKISDGQEDLINDQLI